MTTSVTFAISVPSYSSDTAGLPLHTDTDTGTNPRAATLTPGRPPLRPAAMTTQAPPRRTPLADSRVPRQQAPHPGTPLMDMSVPTQQATPFGPAGHSRAQLSQDSNRRLAARHSQTRPSRDSSRRLPSWRLLALHKPTVDNGIAHRLRSYRVNVTLAIVTAVAVAAAVEVRLGPVQASPTWATAAAGCCCCRRRRCYHSRSPPPNRLRLQKSSLEKWAR